MFQSMMGMIREESVGFIFNLDVQVVPAGGVTQIQAPAITPSTRDTGELSYSAPGEDGGTVIVDKTGNGPAAPTERMRPRRGPVQPPAKGGGAKGAFGQSLDN
jgi:preprotein translocase subunit SecA